MRRCNIVLAEIDWTLDQSSQLGVAVEEVGIGAADTNERSLTSLS